MLVLNISAIILLSLFFYQGIVAWRIGAALFILALIVLSDVATGPVQTTGGYILTMLLSKLLMFVLVKITIRFTTGFGEARLSLWYWLGLFCLPFISIFGMTILSSELSLRNSPVLYPAISGGMFLTHFLLILLCDRMLAIQSARTRNDLLEQQNAYYMNQFLLVKERQEELGTFRHDFKNILLGLRAQMYTGEKQVGINHIDKLLGAIDQTSGACHSGSLIVDAIVNYKQQTAIKYGIAFQADVAIPAQLRLDPYVLSIILGNTLDNAIEACRGPGVTGAYIKLQMHYHQHTLFIRIKNPYAHQIRTNTYGELITTKRDKRMHGFGLKNIKKAVEEVGGVWDISYEQHIFQVEICLFNIHCESTATNK